MPDFYEDPGTGYREWDDAPEYTAEERAAIEADIREAAEAEVWEYHYGTEDERDEAMEER